MLSRKTNKYAKIMRFSVIFIAMVCTGLLYCCNFKSGTDNLQLQSPESDEGHNAGADLTLAGSDAVTNESDTRAFEIYVYVCGCVANPGVYGSFEDMRIYQAIDMAGGMTAEADHNYLNMAEFLKDGQKIYVPSMSENLSVMTVMNGNSGSGGSMLNINTAGRDQLMTLPGIGESRADDIISYRSSNGLFKSIEDIKNVSGIKEAAFARIRELIVVK